MHELCVIGGAPCRKVEFVERGFDPGQALRELHEAVFGKKLAGATRLYFSLSEQNGA